MESPCASRDAGQKTVVSLTMSEAEEEEAFSGIEEC